MLPVVTCGLHTCFVVVDIWVGFFQRKRDLDERQRDDNHTGTMHRGDRMRRAFVCRISPLSEVVTSQPATCDVSDTLTFEYRREQRVR